MQVQITWLMGILAGIIVLSVSIIIGRWFKITDDMARKIAELERQCNVITNDVNILRIGIVKDIESLQKSMEHLGSAIEKLTERLEKTESKHHLTK
jgi:uncharacterized protein YoxC